MKAQDMTVYLSKMDMIYSNPVIFQLWAPKNHYALYMNSYHFPS